MDPPWQARDTCIVGDLPLPLLCPLLQLAQRAAMRCPVVQGLTSAAIRDSVSRCFFRRRRRRRRRPGWAVVVYLAAFPPVPYRRGRDGNGG
ncbi:hypothetical protein CGRA01v4_07340 [Colletotrichum graminicola]|nr:hypothetical protein CGRA01v4_07340 [Colletotrichum graminicola]